MANKIDRPFTLAEQVYHYAVFSGWKNELDQNLSELGRRADRAVTSAIHRALDPKMEILRERITAARRFVFTNEMAQALGYDTDRSTKSKVVDLGELTTLPDQARLPFPTMWFEEETGEIGWLFHRIIPEDPTTYSIHAFYLRKGIVQVLACSFLIGTHPFKLSDRTKEFEREVTLAGWGMRSEDIGGSEYINLKNTASVQLDPYVFGALMLDFPSLKDDAWRSFNSAVKASTGMIPFFLELIMAINSPQVTLDLRVSKGFYRYRLKNHPYLMTNTITINCAPHTLTKYISDQRAEHLRTKHRAHEVRGFWRHYLTDASCAPENHDWTPDELDPDLHHCSRCAGRRRWIKEHMRGDAALGFVEHRYKVTCEPERAR